MTYLYNKNINVLNANTIVATSNPFPVTAVGDGLEIKGISPDAFGRTRVSELFTLGDYKHLFAIDPNFLDVTSNGSVTFEQNKAQATLSTNSLSPLSTRKESINLFFFQFWCTRSKCDEKNWIF